MPRTLTIRYQSSSTGLHFSMGVVRLLDGERNSLESVAGHEPRENLEHHVLARRSAKLAQHIITRLYFLGCDEAVGGVGRYRPVGVRTRRHRPVITIKPQTLASGQLASRAPTYRNPASSHQAILRTLRRKAAPCIRNMRWDHGKESAIAALLHVFSD